MTSSTVFVCGFIAILVAGVVSLSWLDTQVEKLNERVKVLEAAMKTRRR